MLSSMVTEGNGLPEAKMARPPVHLWAASAEHSERDVGFESGKMMGGVGDSFMALSTSSGQINYKYVLVKQGGLGARGCWIQNEIPPKL